uniref:ZP domain-containing protein n=1 Tax=Brugia timori TaxID=42155 RepID=A0A0R3R3I1_9BILA
LIWIVTLQKVETFDVNNPFKFNGNELLICCSISAADALASAIIRFKINGCGSSLVHRQPLLSTDVHITITGNTGLILINSFCISSTSSS